MYNIKLKKIFIFLILSIVSFSCSDSAGSNNKVTSNGPLKIVLTNKTDYEVKKIYYKQTSDFDSSSSFGTELLNGTALADKDKLTLCPNFVNSGSSLPYYFTFVRQKGSTDNNFYITTDIPIYLSNTSGIVNIDLLPYNFYSTYEINTEAECNNGTQNGE